MSDVLITGSTGFIGSALVKRIALSESYLPVITAHHTQLTYPTAGTKVVEVTKPISKANWCAALDGVETVIHTAARVHIMNDTTLNPIEEFRKINTQWPLDLARQAAALGVKRFIFISSIKVNGESSIQGNPFTADMLSPAPLDAYGISKYEAENGLRALAAKTGIEVVIIRPPLVYGPGVKANFLTMMRWLDKGIPLPLGAINNSRSLVSLDNLIDVILISLEHSAAANQTFLVSDGEDLSTSELFRRMAKALNIPARLIPLPCTWLKFGANIIGKQSIYQRLANSLQVDITKTRNLLGWTPPFSVDESLRKTAHYYLKK